MALSKKQRKRIKKRAKTASLEEIAQELKLPLKEVKAYLKKIWRKDKYQKFLNKEKSKERLNPPSKTWFEQNWKNLVFLGFLVLAVYFNSLGNDFVSDDIATIRDHPLINDISYLTQFSLSLRSLIIFLTHKLFGLKPLFYRLSNILFHLGSTWLVYLLIGLFFKAPLPLITASLFAVHPIMTESVTWISGGPYSNGSFFFLLSFLTYLWSKKKRFYLFSIFSFLLAIFFSEKLVVLPLVLLLYELCFSSKTELKKNLPKLIPFFIVGGFWSLYLFGLLGTRTASLQTIHSQPSGLFNPFLQIPVAITSYLELIFWPQKLTLYHSEMSFSIPEFILKAIGLILFLGIMIYFFKKDRRIFFWLIFFFIPLLPTLTPLKIAWIVAERYVYLSSLGIMVLIAYWIHKIGQDKKTTYGLLAIILLLLSARTIIRNADWKNQDVLWLATAKVSPSSSQNHNNLGDLYGRRGDLPRAIQEFQRAIQLNPNYADAYHNLANAYYEIGEEDLAIASFEKALSIKPQLWQSHQNLASIYFNQEEFDLAIFHLEEAIKTIPQNLDLQANLAIIYFRLGEKEKAKEILEGILKLDPQNQKAKEILLSL